jgi:dihydroflavonol-4-reductase
MKAAGREADLAVINPSGIFGPLLDEDPGTSAQIVVRFLKGGVPAVPRLSFAFIDVRDVAAAHVAGLTAPSAGGHRFPLGERNLTLLEFANILRRRFPAYAAKLPRFELPNWAVRVYALFDAEVRSNLGELGVVKKLDSRDAVALLGRGLIPAETAIVATAESLIAYKLV